MKVKIFFDNPATKRTYELDRVKVWWEGTRANKSPVRQDKVRIVSFSQYSQQKLQKLKLVSTI